MFCFRDSANQTELEMQTADTQTSSNNCEKLLFVDSYVQTEDQPLVTVSNIVDNSNQTDELLFVGNSPCKTEDKFTETEQSDNPNNSSIDIQTSPVRITNISEYKTNSAQTECNLNEMETQTERNTERNIDTQTVSQNIPCTISIQTTKVAVTNNYSQTDVINLITTKYQKDILMANKEKVELFNNLSAKSIGTQCILSIDNSITNLNNSQIICKKVHSCQTTPKHRNNENINKTRVSHISYSASSSPRGNFDTINPKRKAREFGGQKDAACLNKLASSLDSLDRKIMDSTEELSQHVNIMNLSKDSVFKSFDESRFNSPSPLSSEETNITQIRNQSEEIDNCTSQDDLIRDQHGSCRLERILNKLQSVEEDALDRLLKAAEAQQILTASHSKSHRHEIESLQHSLNDLASVLERGINAIKDDVKCLTDQRSQKKSDTDNLVDALKSSTSTQINDLSENMIRKQNSSFKSVEEIIELGLKQLRQHYNSDELSSEIKFTVNELKKYINSRVSDMQSSLPENVQHVFDSTLKNEIQKFSMDVSIQLRSIVRDELQPIRSRENELQSEIKEVVLKMHDIQRCNASFNEKLRSKTSNSQLKLSEALEENFQIIQQQVHDQQEGLHKKVSYLTSLLQRQDDFNKNTLDVANKITEIKALVEQATSDRQCVERLKVENDLLRTELENERCVQQTFRGSTSLSEYCNRSTCDLESENQLLTSELAVEKQKTSLLEEKIINKNSELQKSYTFLQHHGSVAKLRSPPALGVDTTISAKERNMQREMSEFMAKRDEVESHVYNIEQRNMSLENRVKFMDDFLKNENKKCLQLQQEITCSKFKISSLQEEANLSREEKHVAQQLNAKLKRIEMEKGDTLLKLEEVKDTLQQNENLIKNRGTQVNQLQRQVHQLSESKIELQSDLDMSQESLIMQDKKLKKKDLIHMQLKRELEILSSSLEGKDIALRDIENQICRLRKYNDDKQLLVVQLQSKVKNLSSQHEKKEGEIENYTIQIDHQKNQIELKDYQIKQQNEKLKSVLVENNDLSEETELLKEQITTLNFIKKEKELNDTLLKKSKKDYIQFQEKISSEFVPKSALHLYKIEMDGKYQQTIREHIARYEIATQNYRSKQILLEENFSATEKNLQKEMKNLGDEVIRLRAKLKLRDEQSNSWESKHARAMSSLVAHQSKLAAKNIDGIASTPLRNKIKSSKPKRKSSELISDGLHLDEINNIISTPYKNLPYAEKVLFTHTKSSSQNNYNYTVDQSENDISHEEMLDESINKACEEVKSNSRSSQSKMYINPYTVGFSNTRINGLSNSTQSNFRPRTNFLGSQQHRTKNTLDKSYA